MTENCFHKHLLNHLSTAVLVLDPDLRVSFISPAAEAMLEISESRGLGHTLEELFPAQPQLLEGFKREDESGGIYTSHGISLSTPSGNQLVVDCTITPMLLTNRELEAVIVELHPLDRILRINRDEGMITSQETTQALIRGLAHEIKNPLGGVRGAAQLLARELPDPALEEYTRVIIEESDRLRDLVDRMLGPHRQPQLADINIHEVLEHVHTLVLAETAGKVEFLRDYDPSVPQLQADRSQLIQAVLNIVRNAVQASANQEEQPVITLRSRVQRQFTIGPRHYRLVCRVDIIDNGPGISPELKDSLFIPMVSGSPDGSGLGLAIAQSIINQHRGLIEYRSEYGCTEFSLYIPLDVDHAENR
ncbi:MAG: nitrogen regulation protein NR(II) [Halieaceae bacterium]